MSKREVQGVLISFFLAILAGLVIIAFVNYEEKPEELPTAPEVLMVYEPSEPDTCLLLVRLPDGQPDYIAGPCEGEEG